ncbi:hypothetical protein FRC10_008531 [Ceratobasidium sp. 414]|nr:hypothetical protein FRC10_008531 [Ceratobasidium sp. 414]
MTCVQSQRPRPRHQHTTNLSLRLCEHEYDIYFTWEHSDGRLCRGKFAKLTTWRLGGSYKPLSVVLPAEAQPGDSWRLCLVAVQPGQSPSLALDLSQPAFGQLPFPVTSMPIDIAAGSTADQAASSSTSPGSKHNKRSWQAKHAQSKSPVAKGTAAISAERVTQVSKQERIERLYLLPPSPDSIASRTLRITEQTSFDLDKVSISTYRNSDAAPGSDFNQQKIWDSGVAVSAWLARLLDTRTESESRPKSAPFSLIDCLRNRLVQSGLRVGRALQIVELGAGTGLVSLVLGALLSALARPPLVSDVATTTHVRILATDLPSAIELIEHNRAANEHLFMSWNDQLGEHKGTPLIDLRGVELDWNKPISDGIWDKGTEPESAFACPFDVIV